MGDERRCKAGALTQPLGDAMTTPARLAPDLDEPFGARANAAYDASGPCTAAVPALDAAIAGGATSVAATAGGRMGDASGDEA